MAIVVVGSVALDTVKTPKGTMSRGLGGSALHFSNAASILHPIKLVGVVGDDFPAEGMTFFSEKGIDTVGLERVSGKTFHWEGYYENDMSVAHTVNTELNVFAAFSPKIPDSYKKEKYLFLANIDPVLQRSVLEAMGKLDCSVMDTMNYWIDTKKSDVLDVISRVDIALLNDQEARSLTGEKNLIAAAKQLITKGLTYAVIKKGEHGAIVVGKDEYFATVSFPVENVVDPTGAGDSFAGGLVSYLAHEKKLDGKTIRKAMLYATAVASFNVEAFSIEGLRRVAKKDISSRIERIRGITEVGEIRL
ncbi:MAG: PfkB family carbohydrate kinase [Spirochaetota bacterium]